MIQYLQISAIIAIICGVLGLFRWGTASTRLRCHGLPWEFLASAPPRAGLFFTGSEAVLDEEADARNFAGKRQSPRQRLKAEIDTSQVEVFVGPSASREADYKSVLVWPDPGVDHGVRKFLATVRRQNDKVVAHGAIRFMLHRDLLPQS